MAVYEVTLLVECDNEDADDLDIQTEIPLGAYSTDKLD